MKPKNWRIYHPKSLEVKAFLRNLCISTARRKINQIRGHSYKDTLLILELMPYKTHDPLFRVLYSVTSNASHNIGLKKENLYIRY